MDAVGDDGAGREGATAKVGRSSLGGAKRGRAAREGGGGVEVAWGHPPPPQQRQRQGGVAASRIYRVKATGGKDRHSKVYTAKGIRDRRVRLSVPTAIQFYDLQDRLGYEQPSKAVEWLINAASGAIDKLPDLDPASFAPVTERTGDDAGKVRSPSQQQQQASKSWCSSTSETSKGSELSLSRSDGRVGGSRDKEVTVASTSAHSASFTELLTGVPSAGHIGATEHRQSWQPAPLPAGAPADCVGIAHHGNGFSSPAVSSFDNAPPAGMPPAQSFNFTGSPQMTHFSLVQNALAAASSSPAGNYSLDFSMSSGFMGANRGTLQSNSPPHFPSRHHHLQKLDGPSPPFLYDDDAAGPSPENHLTASAALQLWNGFRHSGMKEKSKN